VGTGYWWRLRRAGYQIGLYDFTQDTVTAFSRNELLKYRLNPDHLPTHSLVTGDRLVPVLEVDFDVHSHPR
jgi:hypothetical protein